MAPGQPLPHFKNAPIVEALLNLVIAPMPAETTTDLLLQRFSPRISNDYPLRAELSQFTTTVTGGATVSASASQHRSGLIFRSVDGKDIVQSRVDGLAVSRLAPYEGWNNLRERLRKLWDIYVEVLPHAAPAAIGARYINSLSIPETVPMEEFVTAYPEVPHGLPQIMHNFFIA